MLLVQLMKPFYTKKQNGRITLVFAYQYFSIKKDDELFQFIPVEGKEIIVNAKTLQVENLSEVFVFQKGSRFIRLPLYQLLLASDIHKHLLSIIEKSNDNEAVGQPMDGTEAVIHQLERENYERMVDYALIHRNESLFDELQKYNGY